MEKWRVDCLSRTGLEIKDKNGEPLVLGERKLERRHFFGLCPVCKTIGNHSSCSGCLMVFYCSKECQKKDWKAHKILCKILLKLRGKNIHIFHRNPGLQTQISSALSQCL
ncbi:egl nine homolog 1, partial [Eurytemora carolleeae]|uniref:egl nine homolog 1 n=1 Tax=Eurytemora carolleeae TaxID=1294199 RepID=UPI000C7749C6